ncbi:hypothetical protein M409DRAFT_49701 [Zasmidium cellare ATCC 36951]|uniref:Uncharacterized protein n=1 Tax=Zasmidium cellare ATCC 36951 TaxID=1080233 RepID=A0A6A6D6D2_ZASCE|nr:uncharacterized protein M409DRAFT_49701 [Zasmidium cellare ATCC 36951]KAF2173226.1 hypothetical protein M409DRAFT_49701 [Zasmidium cellare ATCC 36951]
MNQPPPPNALREAIESGFGRVERKVVYPERRPSTVVDSNGCIIQRGFLIPNRMSHSHSQTARPSVSTYKPIMGFPRPTGALFDSWELRHIREHHPSSLCRPTKSSGELERVTNRDKKPGLGERRRTWQGGAACSTWTADELAGVTCKPSQTNLNRKPPSEILHLDQTRHMRRAHTVQGNLHAHGDQQPRKDSTMRQVQAHEGKKSMTPAKEDIKLVLVADVEDAIASDSEDDEVSSDASSKFRQLAQQKRLSYAERRSRQDERAAEESDRCVAAYDAKQEQEVLQPIKLRTSDHHESAIESDSEDEDDGIANALKTATLLRARNQIATSQGAAERGLGTDDVEGSHKGGEHRASLSVKIASDPSNNLTVPNTKNKGDVTPREVKSFDVGAPLPCRKLRPSASRPKPNKGVLKKSGSYSSSSSSSEGSSKHVKTVKRPDFADKCRDAFIPAFTALTHIQTYWQAPRTQQQQPSKQKQSREPSQQSERKQSQ